MIDNPELQELYVMLMSVVDGYNRTHSVQVQHLDFGATFEDHDVPFYDPDHTGSLIFRVYDFDEYEYYRDQFPEDFKIPESGKWTYEDRRKNERKYVSELQRMHREGRLRRNIGRWNYGW